MSDLIDRVSVLNLPKRLGNSPDGWDEYIKVSDIENLPSSKPKLKKGEWIPAFNGVFKGGAYWFACSECERIVPEVRNGGWNFCPNCGADMREDT